MKTSLTQEAEAELLGAIIFYNEKSEDLGKDFNKEFEAGVQDIEAFPEFWGNVGRGFRRKPWVSKIIKFHTSTRRLIQAGSPYRRGVCKDSSATTE
jgi:hypothetical protein